MAFTFIGEVEIPMEEFWEWALDYLVIEDMLFEPIPKWENDSVILTPQENPDNLRKYIFIDGITFWGFVYCYFPNVGAETRLSDPIFTENNVIIKVVMGSSTPENWAEDCKPEWMRKK